MERNTFPEVPPRVEYALTDKGRALLPIIEGMREYGNRWLREEGADPALVDVTACASDGDRLTVSA